MTRILAIALVLSVTACGPASSKGAKAANPLPAMRRPAAQPLPKEPPPMERDGFTLKLNHLGFRITITAAPWRSGIGVDDQDAVHFLLGRVDLQGHMDLYGIRIPNVNVKEFADAQRTTMVKDGRFRSVSELMDEDGGRYAVSADDAAGTTRWYVGFLQHPAVSDAYLVIVAFAPMATADAFLNDLRLVLDTVAPL